MTNEPKLSRLLCVVELSELLNVSTRQIYRMTDSGLLPKPLKLGGSNRWDRQVIEEWISRGCPPMNSKGGKK